MKDIYLIKKKINLKEARKKGNLEGFIKEHKKDKPADKGKFKALIDSASSGKLKSTQETSEKDSDDNCNDTQTR